MAKFRINKKRFIPVVLLLLAIIVAVVLLIVQPGADKKPTPANNSSNTNNVEPSEPFTPVKPADDNKDDSAELPPDPDDAAIARAASMQDYTIDQATGRAKDITKTDDNYLLLINRTHALSSTYVPNDLVTVKHAVSGVGIKGETDQLRKVAADAFEEMVAAAEKEGVLIKLRTGYRSYAYQRDRLYNVYVQRNGQKYADTISARPGQSEHQTGLALDVGGASEGYALSRDFGNTREGKWVAAHCHEYGFIIRYTDGTKNEPGPITGFISEPWHLRYVGVQPATSMKESGKLLEQYLKVMY